MYYVYEWFIVETGEIIYVGKGTNRRYKVRKHNKLFNEMISRVKCESRIIKEFESESDAFSFEHQRVEELKSIGQCTCNIYGGGCGGTTDWWTSERRKQYSVKNVMRSEAQRQRMSKNNPMKNHEVAKRAGLQKRRPVIINGKEYDSVLEVMRVYNVCADTVQRWCRKGINSKGESCRYKDEEQVEFTGTRYNKGGCRAIIYDGRRYESGIDIARELGLSNSTINHWAKKGFTPNGIVCRYEDEKRVLTYKKTIPGEFNRKPVIVNGVKYSSIRNAEDALGLKHGYLAAYFKGTRKNSKYICRYDNQQPSRGNSDDSTPEGSTTNG